jgi:hypothetical protein
MQQLKIIALSVVFACVLSLGMMSPGWVFAGAKVDVCHLPPGNPENFHTITINENALDAHLAHGDLEGACNANCASLCDDGNACTIDDTGDCAEVGCPLVPEPVDCNDSDPTTEDSCNPAIGCINTPIITCPTQFTATPDWFVTDAYAGVTSIQVIATIENISGVDYSVTSDFQLWTQPNVIEPPITVNSVLPTFVPAGGQYIYDFRVSV